MNEEWRHISGTDIYEVSSLGRVRNEVSGRVMRAKCRNGYPYLNIKKGSRRRFLGVHRLVAEMFIDNSDNLPCVNHKDGNRMNNRVENLEWCTVEYNNRYSLAKKIEQLSLDGTLIKVWDCGMDIERELGFNQSCVSRCCRGGSKTSYGFKWRHVS